MISTQETQSSAESLISSVSKLLFVVNNSVASSKLNTEMTRYRATTRWGTITGPHSAKCQNFVSTMFFGIKNPTTKYEMIQQ